MANFRYRALTQNGEIVDGSIAADTAAEVALRIEYLGLMPIETVAESASTGGALLTFSLSSPRPEDVTIFTRDLGRGLRVARAVESGNLSVNSHSAVRYWTPFGGYKQSGLGRELGPDAPAAFTEEKNVFIAT